MKLAAYLLLFICVPFYSISAIHYVTESGAGSMTGTSWGNAFPGTQLQAVITNAQPGDDIWVACGMYKPTSGTDRTAAFSMKNDVRIYGGFQGTESSLTDRLLTCGSCSILSGDLGFAGNSDNSYHVISNAQLTETALLDGFIIRDANDDRTVSDVEGLGGGIYNNGRYNGGYCSPTFVNCVITSNYAYFGGGVFNNGSLQGQSNPSFVNCIIADNTAGNGGGGMDNFGLGGTASPFLVNCLIIDNTAQTAGGVYNWGGNPGGNASPGFVNCVIAGNTATNGNAGGFIADNANSGPGNDGISTPVLLNTIVWGNTATLEGPQFFCKGTSTVSAAYSLYDAIGQTAPHVVTGGANNLNSNPMFVNATASYGDDNCWLTADDGFRLQLGSPCINTGLVSSETTTTDIASDPRVVGGNIDMGAYEFGNLGIPELTIDFYAYPNPATNLLMIHSETPKKLTLMTMSGQLVQTIDVSGGVAFVNLNVIPAGSYYLQESNKKGLPIIVQP